jgi:DNA-directed RNA polymerase specialized sigma24 family protein
LSDAELIAAMQAGDRRAWSTFTARYRPILESYARSAKIPRWEWTTCVYDLLADEAIRLANDTAPPPANLPAYLTRAVRHRYLFVKRSASCRYRNYDAASENRAGESVVSSLCSQYALTASAGPGAATVPMSSSLQRLARELRSGLSREDAALLVWVGEGIPRRAIAEWLGVGYDACTKRIWRLCRRLRTQAIEHGTSYPAHDRVEVERFIRRSCGRTPGEGLPPRTNPGETCPRLRP